MLAGGIYVAPGGRHMRVVRDRDGVTIALDDGPPVNFCKPAGRSAVLLGGRGLGPGARWRWSSPAWAPTAPHGAADIVAAGGSVIAQDEATSVVWGMPGSVAQAGLCSAVLPLDEIAPKDPSPVRGGPRRDAARLRLSAQAA